MKKKKKAIKNDMLNVKIACERSETDRNIQLNQFPQKKLFSIIAYITHNMHWKIVRHICMYVY